MIYEHDMDAFEVDALEDVCELSNIDMDNVNLPPLAGILTWVWGPARSHVANLKLAFSALDGIPQGGYCFNSGNVARRSLTRGVDKAASTQYGGYRQIESASDFYAWRCAGIFWCQ